MSIKYTETQGFNPSSLDEELNNLLKSWNEKTDSTWDKNSLSKDFGIIISYLADILVKNQIIMSSYVAKSIETQANLQQNINSGLYAWNSFILFMKDKGFQVARKPRENWDGTLELIIYDTKKEPTPQKEVLQLIFNNYSVSDNYIGEIKDNIPDIAGNTYQYAYTPAKINNNCKIKVNITYERIIDKPYIDDIEIQKIVLDNFNKEYELGNNFAPFHYLKLEDVPYALNVAMQISKDGITYLDEGYQELDNDTYFKLDSIAQIIINKVIV